MKNKKTQERYSLPSDVIFCTKCTMSNQRPRITLDENGVCSACNYAEFKKNSINWNERDNGINVLARQASKE